MIERLELAPFGLPAEVALNGAPTVSAHRLRLIRMVEDPLDRAAHRGRVGGIDAQSTLVRLDDRSPAREARRDDG